MNCPKQSISVLVVDPDTAFVNELKKHPKASRIRVEGAHDGKTAQLLIADPDMRIAAVFINPTVHSAQGNHLFSILKSCMHHRPATPVLLLLDERAFDRYRSLDLSRLRIRASLEKRGLTLERMLEAAVPALLTFDSDETLRLGVQGESLNTELTHDDARFVAIRAEDFVSGSQSFFDVYVRLSTGKYIKLLQSGDAFDSERIAGYLRKGVTHLHIRKEVHESYLKYCESLSTALARKQSADVRLKARQLAIQGHETVNYLRLNGVSEKNIQYAIQFVSNVHTLIEHLKAEQDEAFEAFLSNVAAMEQGTACAMIAGILANSLEIRMEKPVQIVGTASMFQNLGLLRLPEKYWSEDISTMTEEERREFERHPEIGAEILRRIKGVEPGAIQAIEQHHLRRDGKGFPRRYGYAPVNRVAEIVGISGEFHRLIRKQKQEPSFDILSELERSVFPQFSRQVVYAFRSAFFAKAVPGSGALTPRS